MKDRAGTSMTNNKKRTAKHQGKCCLPSWCTKEAAKLFGSVIFMTGILCKYCKHDQERLIACSVCIIPTCAQGWEPCPPSWAFGAWAAKPWWTFPWGQIVLSMRKTQMFYMQTLSFPPVTGRASNMLFEHLERHLTEYLASSAMLFLKDDMKFSHRNCWSSFILKRDSFFFPSIICYL